jgi:hypothetical protein
LQFSCESCQSIYGTSFLTDPEGSSYGPFIFVRTNIYRGVCAQLNLGSIVMERHNKPLRYGLLSFQVLA